MVDRSSAERLLSAFVEVLEGNPSAMRVLASFDHGDLRTVAESLVDGATLVLRPAPVRVLRGLLDNCWSPEEVQAWASFVRRGYLAGADRRPVRPIPIDFDTGCEEEIATAISRLDEIGDLVDGDVSEGEILDLLRLLGEP